MNSSASGRLPSGSGIERLLARRADAQVIPSCDAAATLLPPGAGVMSPEVALMIAAEAGTTFVKIETRFGIEEAQRLRDALEPLAPLRDLRIDFSAATGIEDAALSILAEVLTRNPGCRFRLDGMTQQKRRLLRYMGLREQLPTPPLRLGSPAVT